MACDASICVCKAFRDVPSIADVVDQPQARGLLSRCEGIAIVIVRLAVLYSYAHVIWIGAVRIPPIIPMDAV
jgi:hypothetical protein